MNSSCRVLCLYRIYRHCYVSQFNMRVFFKNSGRMCLWRESRRSSDQSASAEVIINQNVDINILTNGDSNLEKKLKMLFLEVDILRQEGGLVPSHIGEENWKELLSLETRTARKKYLTFCFKKQMKRINAKNKKEEKLQKNVPFEDKQKITRDTVTYGLGGNTLFMRIRETAINNFFNAKLIEALQFSQEIVIDCDYENNMTRREARNCGKQLMYLFSENRTHVNPFNLYFCNARRESSTMQEFEKIIPTAYESHFPLNITEKSYLDLFPKERLVYLTPHCREELEAFDHNAVYIIGGLVDKVNCEPLSLARAKEHGLKMAKLPLDRYLSWAPGSGKSLTLNQMIMIMLDIRHTGNWKTALKHVPQRKMKKVYKVDYYADRFQLIEHGDHEETESKDKYNKFIFKR